MDSWASPHQNHPHVHLYSCSHRAAKKASFKSLEIELGDTYRNHRTVTSPAPPDNVPSPSTSASLLSVISPMAVKIKVTLVSKVGHVVGEGSC